MVQRYRKRPVVVEAVQWNGSNLDELLRFMRDPDNEDLLPAPGVGHTPSEGHLTIPTLEGRMIAEAGDWIIKGTKGEFYPCKPDIFEATYEAV